MESDILPIYDSPVRQARDTRIQPPRPFAPTPLPDAVSANTPMQMDVPGGEEDEKRKKSDRTRRIKLEPVRMPIPTLRTATSTSSLRSQDGTMSVPPQKPLNLKKAHSNIDVTPSSQNKPLSSPKFQSNVAGKVPLSSSVLPKFTPAQSSGPMTRTESSGSVKTFRSSRSNSPKRQSNERLSGSPERKASNSTGKSGLASPSESSEVSSDRDVQSPDYSSSSEGEVRTCRFRQLFNNQPQVHIATRHLCDYNG